MSPLLEEVEEEEEVAEVETHKQDRAVAEGKTLNTR